MRRNGLIILGIAAFAWVVLAIVLDSPSLKLLSGSSTKVARSGASPACLPATLERTASLLGGDVDVSPAPQTDTANPHTQISFLNVPAMEIHEVSVVGARSGRHSGSLHGYSQGDGASFVPDAPFDAGERVAVQATIGPGKGARPIAYSFRVDTPYPTAGVPEFPNPMAAPAEYQSFDTMSGVQAPILSVTMSDRDPAAGDILTTNGPGPGEYGPLIYTPQGRLVWFDRLSGGETAENLSEQTYEGQRDLTWWKGRVLSLGFGQGEDIVMNFNYQTVARVVGGNGLRADLHDFQIAPRDIAYITAYNPIRCDLTPVRGARGGAIVDTAIQEIDIKTGLVRWEWHSLDHVGASESEVQAPPGAAPWDYFHLNSIDPEPNGDLLISARSTWAGYQLEGGSGRILWRLGGNRSSFRMGPGTRMAWQHDGRVLADGELTFFDDGSNPPIHDQSRAVRIALDFKTHEARLAGVYTHPDPSLLAASQGNMQTLADGNTVVGYGAVPEISEYAHNGSLLFDAHQPFDMTFYRAFRFPWSGRPLSPPAILASLNNTGEATIVHASWNGATAVSSWRVLAAQHPGALQAQTTIPDSGFESSTTLPQQHAYVAVQALDSVGRVLATSPTVRVVSYAASLPSAQRSP
ncbi:MAG TPA: arylsulfotransferase family protein [Solirubrobacteraceae bacterium]|nr:arylsulfotransferase family protein [Solirubrobacteraceae bacterium]